MIRKLMLACLAAGTAALAACGGGDEGSTAPPSVADTRTGTGDAGRKPAPAPPPAIVGLSPACQDCGATSAAHYGGDGVGVWRYVNASAHAVEVPVSIAGLRDNEVTLVFTNATATARPMPAIPLTARSPTAARFSALQMPDAGAQTQRRIAEFNRDGWASLVRAPDAAPRIAPRYAVHPGRLSDRRTWFDAGDRPHEATLVRQRRASDGTTVNVWVEDGEAHAAKVSDAILDTMAGWFVAPGKVYDRLKAIGGPFWGPHAYREAIPGEGQPLNIVILNFTNDGEPYGLLGYFYSRDLLTRGAGHPSSNESVALYLDAETMYLDGAAGLRVMGSTLAHEAMHLQNQYRRGMGMGPRHLFDVWLEEATATMAEDFTSDAIDPDYNIVRDARFVQFIAENEGMYNCSLTAWDRSSRWCDAYVVAGAFGGFLNRQLGVDFFRKLLTHRSDADSLQLLDAVIASSTGDAGFAEQLRRFAATSGSLMAAAAAPSGYGFPARAEPGFALPRIDARLLMSKRSLLQTVPETLEPHASVPVVRQSVQGVYQETVTVPPGTLLSVVVQ